MPKYLQVVRALYPYEFSLSDSEHLIDISGLAELSEIKVDPDEVEIGASVTHSQVLQSEQIGSELPLLWEAEKLVAHEVIRNRGTLCGSLAHADPAGEMTAVLERPPRKGPDSFGIWRPNYSSHGFI